MTIEQYHPTNDLTAQMDYSRAVSTASMLPDNYRGKPADIMLAVGLGQSMGLSPAESLYRISVIKGKPTASAELIAANVRKAGHRLRVHTDDEAQSVTATIIRADDPDFEFSVVRDMAWAQKMGLARNDNYSKQPLTMLQWRAITACARLACPEALYGVAYSPDEMGDVDDRPAAAPSTGRQRFAEAVGTATVTAEQVSVTVDQPEPDAVPGSPLLNVRSNLAKALYAGINDAGIEESDRIAWLANVIGRDITTSKEMTEDEARDVLAFLDAQEATA